MPYASVAGRDASMNEAITGKAIGLKTVRGRLLKTFEVAGLLRVSERWVQHHMQNGTFPIQWFPVGMRDRVVDSADLDEWLSKMKISAGTAPLPLKAERKLRKEVST
jgi:predicted DNA-binding transcriptional regulator AlpA